MLKTINKKNKNIHNTEENQLKVRNKLVHLEKHTNRNKDLKKLSRINKSVYYLLLNPTIFGNAWAKLRNNKDSGTPGIDGKTMQAFGLSKAMKIGSKLKLGTFKPKPVRRRWLPKSRKKEKRPLGITTVDDRLVQQAIRGILEAIYEPESHVLDIKCNYQNLNFGFRPTKNTWDAV